MEEHQLQQNSDGWYVCERCNITWKQPPTGHCPAVKLYQYTTIPWDRLATYTQLKRQGLKPENREQPAGCYFRLRDTTYIYLYKIEEAQPRRTPTEKQREAIAKMRAALRVKHTCQRCGWYDDTHGKFRSRYYHGISVLKVGGEEHSYCEDCRRYVIWCHDRHVIEYNMAVWLAEGSEAPPFVTLDTETVGLSEHPAFQVVEVAAVNRDGLVVFHSLIKPDISMPEEATRKHGLTDTDLVDAPSFAEIWPGLAELLSQHEVWAYNAPFDLAAILASAERFKLEVPKLVQRSSRWHCLMREFATYYGAWWEYRRSYKWQDLATACEELGTPSHGYHRAVGDALNVLEVMKALATRGGTYPVPEEQPIYYGSGEYYGGDYDM
jgi:DNA polymerase-3 subunit epsilon